MKRINQDYLKDKRERKDFCIPFERVSTSTANTSPKGFYSRFFGIQRRKISGEQQKNKINFSRIKMWYPNLDILYHYFTNLCAIFSLFFFIAKSVSSLLQNCTKASPVALPRPS
jgi:hypothetical protein